MNAKIRKMLPAGIVPGLHSEMGHHRTSIYPDGMGCNMRRKLNLHRPGLYLIPVARRVTVEEWRKS